MKTVYVVTMYRYGNHEKHSYVLGVWSTKKEAQRMGNVEELWRGDKYTAEITEWIVDANEFDQLDDVISKEDTLKSEGYTDEQFLSCM